MLASLPLFQMVENEVPCSTNLLHPELAIQTYGGWVESLTNNSIL
jgi:hypothetical protein